MKEWAEEHIPHGETRHGFDCDEQCSHVAHCSGEWVMARESCHTYDWVTSHIWMSHVTRTNESCRKYEWVMSQIWMSHGTRVISYIWMSHVTHMNESCRTYEWVMARESCHTYEWDTSRTHSFENIGMKLMAMSNVVMVCILVVNESCHTYTWVTRRTHSPLRISARNWWRWAM